MLLFCCLLRYCIFCNKIQGGIYGKKIIYGQPYAHEKRLLYYVSTIINDYFTATADDFSQSKLSQYINKLKTIKECLATMVDFSKMLYDAGINDGRKEGKAEGKTKEKLATVNLILALGKSLQEIVLIIDLHLAKVKELQA